MNGVNINLFQFEYDLTFMAFFMDAEDHIYARYGGRDDFDAEGCLSKESLLRVMDQVLALHRDGQLQTGRYEATGKPVRTPEEIPPMEAMLARRDTKCIHCHDVKVAELRHLQSRNQFQRDMVFTYPMPSAVGLHMDPRQQNRIASIEPDSSAARSGLRTADVLLSADGHRVLTQADLARVLEQTPSEARLPLEIQRSGQTVRVWLKLSGDWKRGREPAWRESLHVAGPNAGFWGVQLGDADRRQFRLDRGTMAVKVTAIWEELTRQAGLLNGDVVVAFDGLRHDWRINQLHAHLNLIRSYGDTVPVVVLRDGRELELKLKLPAEPPAN